MPLPVDAADRQSTWFPIWLIEIEQILDWVQADLVNLSPEWIVNGTRTVRFASVDVDTLSAPYHGRLVSDITITRSLRESFYGYVTVADITLDLANADGALDDFYYDIRGSAITIKRYDAVSGTTVTDFTGEISNVEIKPGLVTLTARLMDPATLEQLIPSKVVETTTFPKAVDSGATCPVVLGKVKAMRLPYVNDDTVANQYDYLVSLGTTYTVTALYRDGPNNTLYPISPSEYIVSTSLYSGQTVVRFSVRQTNFSGAFHIIYADVEDSSANARNPVQQISAILSNTLWGAGETVNSASITTGIADIDAVGGLWSDGALTTQRQLQEVISELCIFRGIRLTTNASREWVVTVDTEKTTHKMVAQDGMDDGERNVLVMEGRERVTLEDQISTYKIRYGFDQASGEFLYEQSRVVNELFGRELVVENFYIQEHLTADKIVDYLAKQEFYHQDRIRLSLTQEARQIAEGDLILVKLPSLDISDLTYEVHTIRKTLTQISIEAEGWSDAIYDYSPNAFPADRPSPISVYALPPGTSTGTNTAASLNANTTTTVTINHGLGRNPNVFAASVDGTAATAGILVGGWTVTTTTIVVTIRNTSGSNYASAITVTAIFA